MKKVLIILIVLVTFTGVSGERYAVLIGNSHGGVFQQLKYVKNDLQGMHQVLTQFCLFQDHNIATILNKTAKHVDQYFDSLQTRPFTGDDLFLFYYTGHADHANLLMGNSIYSLSWLKRRLENLPIKMRIILLDACQSGSFARLKGGALKSPFLFLDNPKSSGQIILYSSSENEYSQESDIYKNSIFTFHFLNALRGCADISGDKKVTLSEAYTYSYDRTISSTIYSSGGIQHPGYHFNIHGEGDIVLADIASRTCGIILHDNIHGNLAILNTNHNLTADIAKEKGSQLFIAVNPGVYTIFNSNNTVVTKTRVTVKRDNISYITNNHFKKSRTLPLALKGAAPQPLTIGLTILGGFTDFSQSSLAQQCNAQFKGFNRYAMFPQFTFKPIQLGLGLGIDLTFVNRFSSYIHFDYFHSRTNLNYTGITSSPGDTLKYPTGLSIADTLQVKAIHLGVGYTFRNSFFRFLTIQTGIDIIHVDHGITSIFTNSLYNLKNRYRFSDKGFLLLPSMRGLIRFSGSSSPFIIGTLISYRYRPGKPRLQSRSNPDSDFYYNLSGFNTHLLFTYVMNKR